jgi:hypothetical protein
MTVKRMDNLGILIGLAQELGWENR